MHYALAQSLPQAVVVCAFDINTIANDVYEHNHGTRPYQVTCVMFNLHPMCVLCIGLQVFCSSSSVTCQPAAMQVY